jgi:hypothetical protein
LVLAVFVFDMSRNTTRHGYIARNSGLSTSTVSFSIHAGKARAYLQFSPRFTTREKFLPGAQKSLDAA